MENQIEIFKTQDNQTEVQVLFEQETSNLCPAYPTTARMRLTGRFHPGYLRSPNNLGSEKHLQKNDNRAERLSNKHLGS